MAPIKKDINRLLSDFMNLCNAIKVLGELSPRALDTVSSLGERLAVRVLSAAWKQRDFHRNRSNHPK
jgi:aspartate kinase